MKLGRDFKVGLFVLAGLLFATLVIFLIGDERRFFASSVDFHARFSDVQGLKPGAPIQMGGIDIGHVKSVGYGKDPSDPTVYVTFDIVKSESGRIKVDSVAKIAPKGLLGDKMIEITKGEAGQNVPAGGEIKGAEPDDMMNKVGGMAAKADAALDGVQKIAENLSNEQLHRDLRESVASVNKVLKSVSDGEGYPHKFLTDKDEAERISRTLASLDKSSAELAATLAKVRNVIDRVEKGPGFAHDVIYGDGPKKQIEQFGGAAEEVALALKGVRENKSWAHDVLYGSKDENGEALANVTAMTRDLRAIVADMRAGKGTVGALLVDPSVYEDMKMVLGNVQRNDVLRSLVRYSIKQDEKAPAVKVEEGAKSP